MVAGTRQLSGVTAVTSDALERKLVVRFDRKLTSEAVLIAAIDTVVNGIDR